MKNCLILGSGRSGTSMVSGILHQAGYFMGDKLYLPGASNPKGFFEWKVINRINEDILSVYRGGFYSRLKNRLLKKHTVTAPGRNQRWLLALPPDAVVSHCDLSIEERIKTVIRRGPFCYKDPRFSYTLPVWERFLEPGTVFICVFRDPAVTAASILKECAGREYLADLAIDRESAYNVWCGVHTHILAHEAARPDNFFFVHYDQIYDGSALPALSRSLQVELTHDFVDKKLKRTAPPNSHRVPGEVKELYRTLCRLAGYEQRSIH